MAKNAPERIPARFFERLVYRTGILNASSGIKTIHVTSAVPSEGKSLMASLLVRVLSQAMGRTVLFVDANVNNPAVPNFLKVLPGSRVSTLGNLEIHKSIFGKVDVVTAETCRNTLNGCHVADLAGKFNDAASNYDFAVIDSSALFDSDGSILDPMGLAYNVDMNMMVVMARKTSRIDVKRGAVSLEDAGKKFGVILNNVHNHFYK